MDKTLRLIPAVAALGAVLPACADPLVGEWEVTRFKGKVLPKTYSYGGTTYSLSLNLLFEEDGDAEFIAAYTWTGAQSGRKSYSYLGDWVQVSRGVYDIDVGDWDLDCVIAGGELECDEGAERIIDANKKD